MDCREFADRLADLCGTEHPEREALAHAATCLACRRKLERSRLLVATLSELDRLEVPPALDDRIRALVARPARGTMPRLLRAAAAILLLAAGAFGAVRLLRSPERLALTVVEEPGNGEDEEELALREMYGPEGPLLASVGDANLGE